MDAPELTNPTDLPADPPPADPGVIDPPQPEPIDPVDPQDSPSPEDDSEEIEHEGQKYRIPKALKPALMMQADYTRKTQEVAESRRELETQQQQLAQQAQTHQQHLQEVAQVVAYDNRLSQFAQVDWQQLNQSDPVTAQQLWFEYSQLKDARTNLVGQLQQKEQQRQLEMQQTTARRIEEANAALARDIKGWTPELAGKLESFGASLGFSPQELAGAKGDARIMKLMHRAFVGDQLMAKQMAAASPNPAQAQAKPVRTVGSNSPAGKDPARMTTDEWMRHRNDQLRKQRTR